MNISSVITLALSDGVAQFNAQGIVFKPWPTLFSKLANTAIELNWQDVQLMCPTPYLKKSNGQWLHINDVVYKTPLKLNATLPFLVLDIVIDGNWIGAARLNWLAKFWLRRKLFRAFDDNKNIKKSMQIQVAKKELKVHSQQFQTLFDLIAQHTEITLLCYEWDD